MSQYFESWLYSHPVSFGQSQSSSRNQVVGFRVLDDIIKNTVQGIIEPSKTC